MHEWTPIIAIWNLYLYLLENCIPFHYVNCVILIHIQKSFFVQIYLPHIRLYPSIGNVVYFAISEHVCIYFLLTWIVPHTVRSPSFLHTLPKPQSIFLSGTPFSCTPASNSVDLIWIQDLAHPWGWVKILYSSITYVSFTILIWHYTHGV